MLKLNIYANIVNWKGEAVTRWGSSRTERSIEARTGRSGGGVVYIGRVIRSSSGGSLTLSVQYILYSQFPRPCWTANKHWCKVGPALWTLDRHYANVCPLLGVSCIAVNGCGLFVGSCHQSIRACSDKSPSTVHFFSALIIFRTFVLFLFYFGCFSQGLSFPMPVCILFIISTTWRHFYLISSTLVGHLLYINF